MEAPSNQIKKLIDQGRYFEAQSKATALLAETSDTYVKQLYALALYKSGSPEDALTIIEPIYKQFPNDSESAGILGGICKELFKKNQVTSFAIRSRDTYLSNFNATKSFYTGINAASMSAMAGQAGRSREIAAEVITLLDENSDDFWVQATLGEAYLLTKNKIKASEFYVKARRLVGNDWGKVTSVHNQLWLLNHFLQVPTDIMKLFSPPAIVAFVGHMIDHPNRSEPRFPASIEQKIKEAIVHSIRSLNAHIGYCSLACGGDILFAEAMAEQGGEVTIFLPFDKLDFIKTSVAFAGENWIDRFNALLERFPVNYVTNEVYNGLDELFSFQSRIIFGAAVLRGKYSHTEPSLLTVLSDVDLKRKEGGTRATVNMWPFQNKVVNVNPDIFVANKVIHSPVAANAQSPSKISDRAILYLTYIDLSASLAIDLDKVKNKFEQLRNPDQISLLQIENGNILIASESEAMVIEIVRYYAKYKESLRVKNSTRISLHAGPVNYHINDNVLTRAGTTLELVKELQASVTPGSIVVSDYFANLLTLDQSAISLDYGGVFIPADESRKVTVYKVHFL